MRISTFIYLIIYPFFGHFPPPPYILLKLEIFYFLPNLPFSFTIKITYFLSLINLYVQDGKLYGVYVVKDRWERPVLLFKVLIFFLRFPLPFYSAFLLAFLLCLASSLSYLLSFFLSFFFFFHYLSLLLSLFLFFIYSRFPFLSLLFLLILIYLPHLSFVSFMKNPWKVTQLAGEVEYLQMQPWAMPPSEIL